MTVNYGNILITSIGRRVELFNFFLFELRKFKKNLKVYTADMLPDLSAASYISKNSIQLPEANNRNFIKTLMKLML